MIQTPFYEFRESILPARRWKLTEDRKWRPENGQMGNYEIYTELPLNIVLPAYKEVDYESNFSGTNLYSCPVFYDCFSE